MRKPAYSRALRGHTVDFLFTASLFCVFAVCALMLVSLGVHVYQGTARQLENTYSARTALSYAAEKIRQHDAAGQTELTELEGVTAIRMTDQIGEDVYETYIYHDGEWLCELVIRGDAEASLRLGHQILRTADFSVTAPEDGFLKLTARDFDGGSYSLLLHLRSEG